MTDAEQRSSTVTGELLPCPFCGSSNVKCASIRDGANIQCRDCLGIGPAQFSPNAGKKAAEAWNWRSAPAQTAPEPANGLPTLDEYRNNLIEECAKIAGPWPGYWLDKKSTDADRAVVAVRTEIAAKIRGLSVPSTDRHSLDSKLEAYRKALEDEVAIIEERYGCKRKFLENSLHGDALQWRRLTSVLALAAGG